MKQLLVFLVFLCLFTSCEENPVLDEATYRLSSFIIVENGSETKYNFMYDSEGMIQRLYVDDSYGVHYVVFTYSKNTKVNNMYIVSDEPPISRMDLFLKFNEDGFISHFALYDEIKEFFYDACGVLIKTKATDYAPGFASETGIELFDFVDGNLITYKQSSPPYEEVFSKEAVYDDKLNPFFSAIPNEIHPVFNFLPVDFPSISRNNILKITDGDCSDEFDCISEIKYQYNSNDYPVSAVFSSEGEEYTMEYTYIKL